MFVKTTRHRRKTLWQRLVAPTVASLLVAYFAFHALNGELGLVGKARLDLRYAKLQQEFATLKAERDNLMRKVVLLRRKASTPT